MVCNCPDCKSKQFKNLKPNRRDFIKLHREIPNLSKGKPYKKTELIRRKEGLYCMKLFVQRISDH